MLETLHRIIQEVNSAPDLDQALNVIVRRVKEAIKADVCSVYLSDFEKGRLILQATEGLRQSAVGRVRVAFDRGLVGLVFERAEPINVDEAPAHPRYLFTHETGERRFHGFLGVPIIQNRRVLGVLVVRQKEPRSFDDDEVTFLFTLAAQLAGAITHARASGELATIQDRPRVPTRFLEGRGGSDGVALGAIVVAYPPADLEAIPDRSTADPASEEQAFYSAVQSVRQDLEVLNARMEDNLPREERALFDAWLMMLDSDSLIDQTVKRIREGNWAPGALRQTIQEHAQVFDRMEDAYLRERASDVRDLGRRILTHLQEEVSRDVEYPENTILAAEEISAVQLAEVPRDRLAGVVSATGSSSSHVAILARALGVPAVMGVVDLPVGRLEGREAVLDGYRGRVYISPAPSVRREYQRLANEDRVLSNELGALRSLPSKTLDGHRVPLYLNTGLVSEMSDFGAEESAGVGLYRTELPFMIRDRFPGETVQMANYRRVLETFRPRPVTVRTLDIGGDKPLPYFPLVESNPFLGWRGIRISLDHPEIFITQIRAMLRAAVGFDNLQMLLPMISRVSEVDDALALIQRARDELLEEGYRVEMPRIGVMIEVPAAVFQTEALARRVDFLSIGTNDLTQYLLAVDRNNSNVAEIYDDLHPAVLRALYDVAQRGHALGKEVGVCGELAGKPLAAPLLLGMGMDSLSMSAGSLLRVKWVIRSFSRGEARDLLKDALDCEDVADVRKLLVEALEDKGLGGLVRPGK
ncbi:MAG TPA: phosphoenolpyruvate--protein phosphotransferase [Chromatiales bacterium]|nr:phosphoenolpyruvate--protein phosphotransferase [Chromatiales bacterium]